VRKIIEYLHLKDVGLLEMTFALTPMLCGYTISNLTLSLLMWMILLFMVLLQRKVKKPQLFKPLIFLVAYWVVHEVFIILCDDVNMNGVIAQFIYFAAVFTLYPNINIIKLKGSLNWVAIISIVGLLYQWGDIATGNLVHQLEIPGLTTEVDTLEKVSLRPSSFYAEPAAYVAYMICPLYFALMDKKYIWAIGMILSIFLTTSTTGLIVSFIMLGVSILSFGKMKPTTIVLGAILIGVLYLALTNLEAFQFGLEKLENTDTENNVRLAQGRYVVSTMNPGEYVFGVPYSTAYNYCQTGRATEVVYYGKSVYMSTFWQMILLYGAIGLILYLNIYIQIFKQCHRTLTLLAALCAVLFSSTYMMGVYFIFTLIILLSVTMNSKKDILRQDTSR